MLKKREPVGFIINPISGTQSKKKLPDIIVKSLDSKRFEPEIVYSSCPGNAHKLASDFLTSGLSKVVAVGGDGTVNEVASALIDTKATLGIVPLGSGNGLARHLRIPLTPEQAIRNINNGRISMTDYGTINSIPFFCTSGVGFDAHIGNKFAQMERRGFFSYVKTIFNEFFSYNPQQYKLNLNGYVTEREAFLITFANASQWGNNAYIAPTADITDGLLDVTIVSPFPKFVSVDLGLRLFRKKIGNSRYVETFRVKTLGVERANEGYVHFDGEPSTMGKEIEISIKPLGVNIFIP